MTIIEKRYIIIGNYKSKPAEGMEVITTKITNCLNTNKQAKAISISPKQLAIKLFNIVQYRPSHIVFTHGPGNGVLFWSRVLYLLTYAKITFICSRPNLESSPQWLLSLAKTHAIFAGSPSHKLKHIARKNRIRITECIIGIDLERLRSKKLNKNYHKTIIDNFFPTTPDSPLLLHVGHIRNNRNLTELISIKQQLRESVNILLIASPSLSENQKLRTSLEKAGVVIHDEHIADLSTYYCAADLYLFPILNNSRGAIDLPLTVIEALSLGLPVVSTRFGILCDVLSDYNGIRFCKSDCFSQQVISIIEKNQYKDVIPDPLPAEFDLKTLASKIAEL